MYFGHHLKSANMRIRCSIEKSSLHLICKIFTIDSCWSSFNIQLILVKWIKTFSLTQLHLALSQSTPRWFPGPGQFLKGWELVIFHRDNSIHLRPMPMLNFYTTKSFSKVIPCAQLYEIDPCKYAVKISRQGFSSSVAALWCNLLRNCYFFPSFFQRRKFSSLFWWIWAALQRVFHLR